jgi:hypothetical protein
MPDDRGILHIGSKVSRQRTAPTVRTSYSHGCGYNNTRYYDCTLCIADERALGCVATPVLVCVEFCEYYAVASYEMSNRHVPKLISDLSREM